MLSGNSTTPSADFVLQHGCSTGWQHPFCNLYDLRRSIHHPWHDLSRWGPCSVSFLLFICHSYVQLSLLLFLFPCWFPFWYPTLCLANCRGRYLNFVGITNSTPPIVAVISSAGPITIPIMLHNLIFDLSKFSPSKTGSPAFLSIRSQFYFSMTNCTIISSNYTPGTFLTFVALSDSTVPSMLIFSSFFSILRLTVQKS